MGVLLGTPLPNLYEISGMMLYCVMKLFPALEIISISDEILIYTHKQPDPEKLPVGCTNILPKGYRTQGHTYK